MRPKLEYLKPSELEDFDLDILGFSLDELDALVYSLDPLDEGAFHHPSEASDGDLHRPIFVARFSSGRRLGDVWATFWSSGITACYAAIQLSPSMFLM